MRRALALLLIVIAFVVGAPRLAAAGSPAAPAPAPPPPPASVVVPHPVAAAPVTPAVAPAVAPATVVVPAAPAAPAPRVSPTKLAPPPAVAAHPAAPLAPRLVGWLQKGAAWAATETYARNGVRDPARDGSNGGQWFKDSAGAEWFGKPGKGDASELDRLGNEQAMSRIYHAASGTFGTIAPDVRAAIVDGRAYLMSRKLPLAPGAPISADQLKRFGEGFVIDAWLANWDIGVPSQLVADVSGRMLRVDGGGGGLFRARGEPKGAAFGEQVTELKTMRDPARPSSAGFRTVTDADVKVGLQKFAAWYPAHRGEVEAAIEGTGMSPAAATELRTKLAARAQWLIGQAGVAAPSAPVPPAVASPVPPAPVPTVLHIPPAAPPLPRVGTIPKPAPAAPVAAVASPAQAISRETAIAEGKAILDRHVDRTQKLIPSTGFATLDDLAKAVSAIGPTHARIVDLLKDEKNFEFAMAVHEQARDGVAMHGFLNQYDSQHSGGTYSPDLRANAEAGFVGMSRPDYDKVPTSVRPKYGYLRPSAQSGVHIDERSVSQYGSDVFVFKRDAVRDHTTFYPTDSLGFSPRGWPARPDATDATAWHQVLLPWSDRMLLAPDFEVNGADLRSTTQAPPGFKPRVGSGSRYIELQIWRPLGLQDVERFEFQGSPPTGAFLKALRDNGVQIFKKGAPTEWKDDQVAAPRASFRVLRSVRVIEQWSGELAKAA